MNSTLEKNLDNKSKNEVQTQVDAKIDAKKTFDFKIAGVSYKIKSSHDEKTLQELVSYVNNKVTEAIKVTKNSSFQNAAVLASLNIAEEMILLKRKAQHELDKLENKAIKLAQEIDSAKINKFI